MTRILALVCLILSFLPALSTGATSGVRHEIALSIYLADEIAFRSLHAEYLKEVFSKIYPNIEFKQIVIPVSVIGLGRKAARERIRQEIRNLVHVDDEVKFLFLDTHGNTVVRNHKRVTSLATLGYFGSDSVDEEFDRIFSYLRTKTSSDLTVVLNSCLTFCGPPEESQKRAALFLKYFSAPEGKIYGAYVKEVDDVYVEPSISKLKYFRPSWKVFLTMMGLFGAATGSGSALFGDPTVMSVVNEFLRGSFSLGLPLAVLTEATIPVYSWWAGQTFANRGWLFSFYKGKLKEARKVQKPRDLKLILGSSMCERFFK